MSDYRNSELGGETGEREVPERRIESLDDITREIADRRLHLEFSEHISPEKAEALRETPDRIEKPEEFAEEARKAGIENSDGVVGFAKDLESPAHIRKDEVPKEIATGIHEDLHRLTHPETLREMTSHPATRELYEGITEYFTERAVEGLHEHRSGEAYPEQVRAAEKLAWEVGEGDLRKYFFQNEMSEELERALQRIREVPEGE